MNAKYPSDTRTWTLAEIRRLVDDQTRPLFDGDKPTSDHAALVIDQLSEMDIRLHALTHSCVECHHFTSDPHYGHGSGVASADHPTPCETAGCKCPE